MVLVVEEKSRNSDLGYSDLIDYARGDSMNGTLKVSWQRPCAIDIVKLRVTKSSVKSRRAMISLTFDT